MAVSRELPWLRSAGLSRLKPLPRGLGRSVLVEDLGQRGGVEQALGPVCELGDVGLIEARAGVVASRANVRPWR
jgi:hypothetical protein